MKPAHQHQDAPSDADLIERASGGEAAAFEELVCRHERALYRFATRLCPSAMDAEDALQEALFSGWRAAGDFRGESSVRTWLFQITLNACRRHGRARAAAWRSVPLEAADQIASAGEGADSLTAAVQIERVLRGVLLTMHPEDREVLLLRDVEGLRGEEVAHVLLLSVPAMKSRLHRARLRLKEALEKRLGLALEEELR